MSQLNQSLRNSTCESIFVVCEGRRSTQRWKAVVGTLTCIAITFCSTPATIWSAQFESPDGVWIGTAHTKEWAGPGTAAVETYVFLKQARSSQPPQLIAQLDNESMWPKGITNIEMTWLTPSHLEVGYRGHATISFQAVKIADLEISIRDLSQESIRSSK